MSFEPVHARGDWLEPDRTSVDFADPKIPLHRHTGR
jgi:hypothetical protein